MELNSISSGISEVGLAAAEENSSVGGDDGMFFVVATLGFAVNGCVVWLRKETQSRIDETDATDDVGNGRNIVVVLWRIKQNNNVRRYLVAS